MFLVIFGCYGILNTLFGLAIFCLDYSFWEWDIY